MSRIIRQHDQRLIVADLEIADSAFSRLRGLQFRARLPQGTGLLLVPCSSLHTHWMRFSVDMIMLGAQGQILEVRPAVRPWRFVWGPKQTHAVLELPAGAAADLQVGERLLLENNPSESQRPSVTFLRSTVVSA